MDRRGFFTLNARMRPMNSSQTLHLSDAISKFFPTSLLYDELWTETWNELPPLPPQVEAIADEILDEEIERISVLLVGK
jgi:hypothetical protein